MATMRLASALAIFLAALSVAVAQSAPSEQELCAAAQPAALTPMQFESPESVLEPGADYRAIFCTSAGAIYVDLYEELTPRTVNSFVFLAQQGYYDSTTFHRVIPNFMAQAGDPTGTGRGGPGYQFGDEPVGYLVFDRPGLLAMANAGPGTNGSQFFITTAPTPHLNHKHTIFGDVLVGQEIVEAIRERDPATAAEAGETLHTVLIISDPASVDNSVVLEPTPAQQDEVIAAFEAFRDSLPPNLPSNPDTSGLIDAQRISQGLPEDLRSDFLAFADNYGHQYRYRLAVENAGCEPAIYFSALGYWVDVYADAASARAAAEDAFMLRWLDSFGYTQDEIAPNHYQAQAPTCGGEAGIHLLALYPRGRFLATLDVLLGQAVMQQAGVSPQALLANLALQIEPGFSDIFRREIR